LRKSRGKNKKTELSLRLAAAGVGIALADLTPAALRETPFCVVRARGANRQTIHGGNGLEHTQNPRLHRLLTRPLYREPHPLC
jgi:hypothetical protein